MVSEGGYDRLREHLRDLLRGEGIHTRVTDHPWVIRELFAALSWVEGHIFRRGMATRMERLVGAAAGGGFELTIHATDLSVVGQAEAVSTVFAILAEQVDPRVAYPGRAARDRAAWQDQSRRP